MSNQITKIFSTRNIIILLVLLVIATISFYGYLGAKKANAPVEVPITTTDHYTGPADSKNILVEYGDFQCPACAAYYPVVKKIAAENSTDLKFVFKNFPLVSIHKNARLAATIAEAAALQNKYWEMHDLLYENQKVWADALDAKDKIFALAANAGIDTVKLAADMETAAVQDKVTNDLKEAVALGLESTPSFVLNGKRVDTRSISSFEAFSKLVKDSLVK